MNPLRAFVDSLGGFARTRELLAHGASERMLTAAVRGGILNRARNGWYSTRPESDPRFRAVRVGGKLTGISALQQLGVWEWWRNPLLHVSVPRPASRLRAATTGRRVPWKPGRHPDLVVHWEAADAASTGTRWSVGVVDALVRVVLDEPLEQAILALDWAWCTNRIDLIDFERVLLAVPARRRVLRAWVDRSSASILESTARLRMLRLGHRVRSQVPVEGHGALDLLVDDEVGLDLDGAEYHRDRFEIDRAKDVALTREGRHVIRPSWSLVRDSWSSLEAAIEMALARRGVPAPSPERRAAASSIGNSGIRPATGPRGRRVLRPRARGS